MPQCLLLQQLVVQLVVQLVLVLAVGASPLRQQQLQWLQQQQL